MLAPHACSSCLLLMPAPHACSSCLLLMLAPHACSSCLLLLLAPHACSSCLLLMLAPLMLAPHACSSCLLLRLKATTISDLPASAITLSATRTLKGGCAVVSLKLTFHTSSPLSLLNQYHAKEHVFEAVYVRTYIHMHVCLWHLCRTRHL